jgi:peptide/nickel transport system permease protein
MATTVVQRVPDTRPQWQKDLDSAGLVRRLLISRHWYGADWWFVLISALALLFIVSVGFFPGLSAPCDPRAEVGPPLLAPGKAPPTFVLVSQGGVIQSIDDLAGRETRLGIVRGSPSAQVLRDAIDTRLAELEAAGEEEIYLRPRLERYDDVAEALNALAAGEVDAVIALNSDVEPLLKDLPGLVIGGSVSGFTGRTHTLGTNQLGQDVLSRVIWGTRIALVVGFAAALFALLVGVPLGLVAGFWSGRLERLLTLFMDSMYSFPGLILAIAITSVLGPGILNVIVAISTLYVPTYYRIVRGQTMAVKEELYVEAARSLGAQPFSILARYIFPNVIPSVVVIFSVNVADAILTEAGLSFLGLGLPPDTPDWGIDLAIGQDLMRQAWWLVTFPGIMIALVTLGFSMLGESLSEILNPRLTEN